MGLGALIRRLTEHSSRIDRMMAVLRVTDRFARLANGEGAFRRASERCQDCPEPEACEEWLASHERAPEAPPFCRNHDLFVRLKDRMETELGHDHAA